MDKEQSVIRTLPIVAVRGTVVFPHTDTILSFGRPKSVAAVNASFQENRVIAIFTQKNSKTGDPDTSELYRIGTLATITQIMTTEGEIHAMVKGQARVELQDILTSDPYIMGRVREITETETTGSEVEALHKSLNELFKKVVNLGKDVDVTVVMRILSNPRDPVELADSVSSLLDIKTKEKQKLLETFSVKERLKKVLSLMVHEVNVLDLERSISMKTQKRFEDQMRKAMLREKKRTIEAELGEDDENGDGDEITSMRKKIKKAGMPKETKKKALKELKKLTQLSQHNPEGGYIRNYLDWLVEIPWYSSKVKDVSVGGAAKILDTDHYGLEKAKERILEYLAVMKLKAEAEKGKRRGEKSSHPTILCFVGPPGVGKTSIGKSIAKALDRKFVRVSLGGIRDEAEMRGHRRTYVGAMPGRIIQSIKTAGAKNPVFMLDEIDKLGSDYRGDPSSALLEILDPEQNKEFSDHYLEVPYDLSEVTFICTANVLDTIPAPLKDRMEIIKFAGYIEDEKFHIGKIYLWPKQLEAHGLKDRNLRISDRALRFIVKHYTREAGVRELERSLATILRKIARLVAEEKKYPKTIENKNVIKFLGPIKFRSQIAETKNETGMATGLAYTPTGGDILFIEVALMPGAGKLTLTGKLGTVMKESAKAAFTWTKSHWAELGLPEGFGKGIDVHIHVPEGATPKDGPSAGVSISTALVSALTGIPVRRDVAMTGEVTLRGRVLEIGGVKEKVIAAHRAGIKTVILPRDNNKDLEDIPLNVKKDLKFVFAEHLHDVLGTALTSWPITKISRRKGKSTKEASFLTTSA